MATPRTTAQRVRGAATSIFYWLRRKLPNANQFLALGTWVLAVVALLALYDGRRALEQSQRAWIAPTQLTWDPDRPPTANDISIRVIHENTGKEPALNVAFRQASFFMPTAEIDWQDVEPNRTCDGLEASPGLPAIYPAASTESIRYVTIPNPFGITVNLNDPAIYFTRGFYENGCFAYIAAGHVHQSAYCFYLFPDRNQPLSKWQFKICPTGNWAN